MKPFIPLQKPLLWPGVPLLVVFPFCCSTDPTSWIQSLLFLFSTQFSSQPKTTTLRKPEFHTFLSYAPMLRWWVIVCVKGCPVISALLKNTRTVVFSAIEISGMRHGWRWHELFDIWEFRKVANIVIFQEKMMHFQTSLKLVEVSGKLQNRSGWTWILKPLFSRFRSYSGP